MVSARNTFTLGTKRRTRGLVLVARRTEEYFFFFTDAHSFGDSNSSTRTFHRGAWHNPTMLTPDRNSYRTDLATPRLEKFEFRAMRIEVNELSMVKRLYDAIFFPC
jgi:hypothetical protein